VVRKHLDRRGIDPNDPVRAAVERACDAVHTLRVRTMYNACDPRQVGG
jgi:hypothetical protein